MSTFWPIATPFGPGDTVATILGLGAALVIWLQAYPLQRSAWEARWQAPARAAGWQSVHTRAVWWERLSGALLFAVAAVVLTYVTGGTLSWLVPAGLATNLVWCASALVLLPFVVNSTRKATTLARYPEIRAPHWSRPDATKSVLSFAAYLLGYECFFRGALTFGLTAAIGIWPGLALVTAIYVAQHLRKGADEAFSCIPMGLVFGLMALQTGSIWIPWIVHVLVATTNEVLCARRNTTLSYPF